MRYNVEHIMPINHCKFCGKPLVELDGVCANCGRSERFYHVERSISDHTNMRNLNKDEEESYKQGLEKISAPTGIKLFDIKPNVTKKLNINKINTLEDVKRVLEFLDIKVDVEEGLIRKGFDKVEDLFD